MINDFITHLGSNLVNYNRVDHAWDVEPFQDVDASDMPIALAFLASESSQESNADNRVRQRADRELWVYTICSADQIEARRDELLAAALGWQLSANWDALQHRRGEIRKLAGEYIWWLDVFATWRLISET